MQQYLLIAKFKAKWNKILQYIEQNLYQVERRKKHILINHE